MSNTGHTVANNPRITTNDTSGVTQSSTITITGFTTADNGTIQCINLADSRGQGMASISVGEWLFQRIRRYNTTVYSNNCLLHFPF